MPTRTDIIDCHLSCRVAMKSNEGLSESLQQRASNEGSFVQIDPVVQIL